MEEICSSETLVGAPDIQGYTLSWHYEYLLEMMFSASQKVYNFCYISLHHSHNFNTNYDIL